MRTETRDIRYERGERHAAQAIEEFGGEFASQYYERYFSSSTDDYARGYASVIWQWRMAVMNHPSF